MTDNEEIKQNIELVIEQAQQELWAAYDKFITLVSIDDELDPYSFVDLDRAQALLDKLKLQQGIYRSLKRALDLHVKEMEEQKLSDARAKNVAEFESKNK